MLASNTSGSSWWRRMSSRGPSDEYHRLARIKLRLQTLRPLRGARQRGKDIPVSSFLFQNGFAVTTVLFVQSKHVHDPTSKAMPPALPRKERIKYPVRTGLYSLP